MRTLATPSMVKRTRKGIGIVAPQRSATGSANDVFRPEAVRHSSRGGGLVDWSDPSRTDVVAKSSGMSVTRASFSGSEHEDTEADLRVRFELPSEDLTVRVSPEFTDALLSVSGLRPDKDEATVVDGWANRPAPAALRSVTGRRPVALPRQPEPPPPPILGALPKAPRVPSEFAPADAQAPLAPRMRKPVPAKRSTGQHAKWLVSSAFLIVATFMVARGASDRHVRARAADTFAELRRALSARLEASVPSTQRGPERAPAARAGTSPRVAAARPPGPIASTPPRPARDPSIPVVRVEDLPLLGACEGPGCDDDALAEEGPMPEGRSTKRRPKP